MKIPALIDIHVHLRDPGLTYKEDILTGSTAAYYGGFSTICCMPNTKPTLDTPELIKYVLDHEAKVKVLPIGAITKSLEGKELTDFKALKAAGAIAISDDGMPVIDNALFEEALIRAKEINLPIAAHSEDFNAPNSRLAEENGIYRDIQSSIKTNSPLHLCHVSTKGSIQMVREAKKDGANITSETCPHYFTLTSDRINMCGANAKMNPPLREKEDVEAVIEGLVDGTIDAIATDHAPHSREEKTGDKPPNGIIGLETAFPLSYTYLVKTGFLNLEQLSEKMTYAPARIFNIEIPNEMIEVDLDNEYIIGDKFHSKSSNSPFVGLKVYGRILR